LVICHFLISVAKNNENLLLVFKNRTRMGFLALGFNEKTIFGPGKEKVGLPWARPWLFFVV
jgi:hypothetical protein